MDGVSGKVENFQESSGGERIEWSGATLDRGDARLFVGSNFERYWKQWSQIHSTALWKNWNWASAFLSVIWLGFRRMHKFAGITLGVYLVLSFLIGYVAGKAGGSGDGLMWLSAAASFVIFGLIGDRLYLSHTVEAVRSAAALEPTPDGRAARLRLVGDASYPLAFLWAIGSYVGLFIALSAGMNAGGSGTGAAPTAPAAQTPSTPTVRPSATCDLLPARVAQVRRRIDTLRLDYPGTTTWVCQSLKSRPADADASALAIRLTASYAACALVGTARDCNYVIGEYIDLAKGAAVLEGFARENSCPMPSLPAPCN